MHKSYTGIRLYTVLVRTVAKLGVEKGRAEEKGGGKREIQFALLREDLAQRSREEEGISLSQPKEVRPPPLLSTPGFCV